MTQNTDTVQAGADQAAIDIAMQEGGSIEAVFEFLQLNNMSLTEDLTVGAAYKKPSVIDESVAGVFNEIIKPASADIPPFDKLPLRLEGIDYWAIEDDFIVS